MKQAVAPAGNRTCVELSSARSTRTGFEPFSAAISTSSSSSRSCRGAIVGLHALAEFCISGPGDMISQSPLVGRWGDALRRVVLSSHPLGGAGEPSTKFYPSIPHCFTIRSAIFSCFGREGERERWRQALTADG
eukprot:scaffold11283_cov137-Isochrysis_galbana.AAC.1